ncbi:NADH-quinone oxidoreductase subunit A, partial [Campylobacter concisus]|uniref:NADH-quinone oxidoreductase subunit A n=1 Tax=Campylobacter concisus TaxID=199 RepID=UPI000CD91167
MSHSELDSTYLGAFIILLLATCSFSLITFLSSKISKKLANRNTERLKVGFYECGPTSVKQTNMLNISYFYFGLFFLIFNVEVILLYPCEVDLVHPGL